MLYVLGWECRGRQLEARFRLTSGFVCFPCFEILVRLVVVYILPILTGRVFCRAVYNLLGGVFLNSDRMRSGTVAVVFN